MQLSQILKIEFVNANLLGNNKSEALAELSNTIIEGGLKLDHSSIIDVLQQRENLGSTGIGEGVAIPHGKISNLKDIVVAFGRSLKGVEYDAQDGKPVHLIFLLLAPENSTGEHLKILARISKMLKIDNFRDRLLHAESQGDLYKIIIEQELSVTLN